MESATGSKTDFLKSTAGMVIIIVLALAAGFFGGMEYKSYQVKSDVSQTLKNFGIATDSSNSARAQAAREAKRVADVRQISSALELYYNDKGGYPASLSLLSPDFITALPTAATPTDGSCTESQNNYAYTSQPDGKDYALSFCLGQQTGGYDAGVHTLTSMGIK